MTNSRSTRRQKGKAAPWNAIPLSTAIRHEDRAPKSSVMSTLFSPKIILNAKHSNPDPGYFMNNETRTIWLLSFYLYSVDISVQIGASFIFLLCYVYYISVIDIPSTILIILNLIISKLGLRQQISEFCFYRIYLCSNGYLCKITFALGSISIK